MICHEECLTFGSNSHVFFVLTFTLLFRAGGTIDTLEGTKLVSAPPVTIMIDQNLVENTTRTSDGEKKQQAHTEQELFGVCCSISDDALVLHAAEMTVKLDSPSAGKLFFIDSRE